MAVQGVTSKEVTNKEVTSKEVTSKEVISKEVTSKEEVNSREAVPSKEEEVVEEAKMVPLRKSYSTSPHFARS